MSLYLLLNIGSFIVPFAYSFESRMRFINRWKAVLTGISITALFFIVWDIIFTQMGVWSFNERYHSGLAFWGLPIEEWLFFFCIPYASLFIHFAFQHFFPKTMLSNQSVKWIYGFLMILILPVIGLFFGRLYTTISLILLVLLLTYAVAKMPNILKTFFITFLVILIPFSLVNGILTGSFIDEPVVIYNNAENMGIRLGTIPVEDTGYAFSMLLMSLILIEKFERVTK